MTYFEKVVYNGGAWQRMITALDKEGFSPRPAGDERFALSAGDGDDGTISRCIAHRRVVLAVEDGDAGSLKGLRAWAAQNQLSEVAEPGCGCFP